MKETLSDVLCNVKIAVDRNWLTFGSAEEKSKQILEAATKSYIAQMQKEEKD